MHDIVSAQILLPWVNIKQMHSLPLFIITRKCREISRDLGRQDGRHFQEGMFEYIFLKENACIFITISMKFVPKGPVNNIPPSVQIMAWRRPGNKPFSGPMIALFADAYMRHPASLIYK